MNRVVVGLALLAMCVAITGCAAKRSVPKASVSGKVTLNGKPLAGVGVHFNNEEANFEGFGKTKADGTFTLVTGAAIGANTVYFSDAPEDAPDDFSDDPELGMDDGQMEAQGLGANPDEEDEKKKVGKVPEDYASLDKSQLTFDVPSGGATDANFNLQ